MQSKCIIQQIYNRTNAVKDKCPDCNLNFFEKSNTTPVDTNHCIVNQSDVCRFLRL